MKKFYLFIIIGFIILFVLGMTKSYAKYTFHNSSKILQIHQLFEPDLSPATISGRFLTENWQGTHISSITLYKSSDANHENPVLQQQTNQDGTFHFTLEDIDLYDLVVAKESYLSYTILQINTKQAKTIVIPDYKLLVGDFIPNEQIGMSDWRSLLNQKNKPVTSLNKIYDVNCDGVIDDLDIAIVKPNFGKIAEPVIWSK